MVNNAGMHVETGNVWETETDKLDRVMAVNFEGIFFGCKYGSPDDQTEKRQYCEHWLLFR